MCLFWCFSLIGEGDSSKISGGGIAAIVIGCVALVVLVAVSTYRITIKYVRDKRKQEEFSALDNLYAGADRPYTSRPGSSRPGTAMAGINTKRGAIVINSNDPNISTAMTDGQWLINENQPSTTKNSSMPNRPRRSKTFAVDSIPEGPKRSKTFSTDGVPERPKRSKTFADNGIVNGHKHRSKTFAAIDLSGSAVVNGHDAKQQKSRNKDENVLPEVSEDVEDVPTIDTSNAAENTAFENGILAATMPSEPVVGRLTPLQPSDKTDSLPSNFFKFPGTSARAGLLPPIGGMPLPPANSTTLSTDNQPQYTEATSAVTLPARQQPPLTYQYHQP